MPGNGIGVCGASVVDGSVELEEGVGCILGRPRRLGVVGGAGMCGGEGGSGAILFGIERVRVLFLRVSGGASGVVCVLAGARSEVEPGTVSVSSSLSEKSRPRGTGVSNSEGVLWWVDGEMALCHPSSVRLWRAMCRRERASSSPKGKRLGVVGQWSKGTVAIGPSPVMSEL